MHRGLVAVIMLAWGASSALAAAGEDGPAPAPWFPLGKGYTWKYSVSAKTDETPDKPYFQTLDSGPAAEDLLPIGDDYYVAKPDGFYLAGRRIAPDKVERLAEPRKVLPRDPRTGDTWKVTVGPEVTQLTCLGARTIQTEAGKFDAQCIIYSAERGDDPAWTRQGYRYYARGIGLVRETLVEDTAKAGVRSRHEFGRELITFHAEDAPAPKVVQVAKPLGTEQVRGQLLDPVGQPIAQAAITLRRTDQAGTLQLQTDVFGRFNRADLDPAGTYELIADLTGYQGQQVPLHSPDGSALSVQVRLRPLGSAAQPPTTQPRAALDDGDDLVARPLFLAVADTQPSDAAAFIQEGRKLAQQERHDEAIEQYRKALERDATSHQARAFLALSLTTINQLEEAQQQVAIALKAAPNEWLYHQVAGRILILRGDLKQGQAEYEQAARLSPRSAGVVWADFAGSLAARNDRTLDAQIETALKAATSAQPPHLDSFLFLGQSYMAAGKPEARDYLQRYVTLASALPKDQRDDRKLRLAKQLLRALEAVRG